jgi:hypothetical protein
MSLPTDNKSEPDVITGTSEETIVPSFQSNNLTDSVSGDINRPRPADRRISVHSDDVHNLLQTSRARSIEGDVSSEDDVEERPLARHSQSYLAPDDRRGQGSSGSYHTAHEAPKTATFPQVDATTERTKHARSTSHNREGIVSSMRRHIIVSKSKKGEQGHAVVNGAEQDTARDHGGSSNTTRSFFPIFRGNKRHLVEDDPATQKASIHPGPYEQGDEKIGFTHGRSRWNMGILSDLQTDEVPGKS